MKSPKIISHAGLSINLADVKCLKLSIFGEKNIMTVEFKSRYDYILNPISGEFEKQEYNEKTEVEFPDYDTASTYKYELQQIWQKYLEEEE